MKNVVLIIEADEDTRNFITEALQPDYDTVEAATGAIGKKKTKELIPDMVVCDAMLPDINARRLCRELKKQPHTSHILIILLTGRNREENGKDNPIDSKPGTADDFITKPFNAELIKASVNNLFHLRKQQQLKIQRQMMMKRFEIEPASLDKSFIKKVCKTIQEHLTFKTFNVEILATEMETEPETLNKKIMALTGLSPEHFINSIRLKRAAELLESDCWSISQVAAAVGFESPSEFSKQFNDTFHQLPTTYQARKS